MQWAKGATTPECSVQAFTLAALKKAEAVALVKQRSVAHSVHLTVLGCSSVPAGTSADTSSGSSNDATWLDTVIRACRISRHASIRASRLSKNWW